MKRKNDCLEAELAVILEIKRDCDNAKYSGTQIKRKCGNLELELEYEKEEIKIWTNFGRKVQVILADKSLNKGLSYETSKNESSSYEKVNKNIRSTITYLL